MGRVRETLSAYLCQCTAKAQRGGLDPRCRERGVKSPFELIHKSGTRSLSDPHILHTDMAAEKATRDTYRHKVGLCARDE